MISYKNRFHGHGSLKYLYKNGQSNRSKLFHLRYSENKMRKNTRIAVVVSKKIFKGAVKRNRVRRRVYEAIRSILPKIEGVHDIALIIVSGEVIDIPYKDLVDNVENLLIRASIIK